MEKVVMFIKGLSFLFVVAAGVGYLVWRTLKRSQDSARLIVRWVLTAIVLVGILTIALPATAQGGISALFGLIAGLILGLAMALIWTPSIVAAVGNRFEALYTGGDTPPEPEAVYSAAIAKRLKGDFRQAIYLIQEQLGQFPNDFRGQMLLAEIHAQNLDDLECAENAVLRIVQQPEHPSAARAFALNTLADWYLSLRKDVEGARKILEMIPELLPDSEHSIQAAQRLAHMASPEFLHQSVERKTIKLTPGIHNLGLKKVDPATIIKAKTPEQESDELVVHLEEHPLDLEARERLALIYAYDFRRLDLAQAQMEQLIGCPHVPSKQQTRWLNMLADMHVRLASDLEAAAATIQQIIARFPSTALASQAQDRLATLPGELRPNRPNEPIKMGTYEQRLGLKMKSKTKA